MGEKMVMKISEMKWKCHICKEERDNDKITVYKKPIILNGRRVGDQNIRVCNDRRDCLKRAEKFSFLKNL